ncbi:cysteine--tRNA ligase [Hyphomicrobium sp.]|uniref:cysteine--tRNA ligase n=1 Tax=Hyphomicrobium sp. TaxID=82 RepID=UPI002FDD08EA
MSLTLYNTLSRRKEPFTPIDPANVRMYVCGPTVYDYAHIGNARPVIVFDMLFRLLRHVYGAGHVTYVRNITDVDDKINARAAADFPDMPLNEAIRRVTGATERQFHDDIGALGVLPPTVEPRATEHIEEMTRLIEALITRGHAYVAEGHALFDVSSMPDYGRLSNRSLEEMEAGARVEVAPYKKGAMDFVLWKPSKPGEPAWPSPAGIATPGRPGWHIECSAMAEKHLGPTFDIHGGGIDLVFPHHENEIAQSRCAHGLPVMANVWMHNGFLQVEGEKMSKSLGNFITIHDLLATKTFGANQWHGRVIRFAMLGTHYRQPIDWTAERLLQARATLSDFAALIAEVEPADAPNADVVAALSDDLNTPSALSIIHGLAKSAKRNAETAAELRATLEFMGLYGGETRDALNVGVEVASVDADQVDALVAARLAARKAKDFKESDRLRDELAAMGVALKDAKDPSTGEITTSWEIAR